MVNSQLLYDDAIIRYSGFKKMFVIYVFCSLELNGRRKLVILSSLKAKVCARNRLSKIIVMIFYNDIYNTAIACIRIEEIYGTRFKNEQT